MRKISNCFMKYKGMVLYCVFGLLTTAVNYLVYFPLIYAAGFSAVTSNILSWFAAVLFAFMSNKTLVFGSSDWTFRTVLKELCGFFGCRFLTGALETFVLFISVDLLNANAVTWKVGLSIFIVVLNYFSSKLLVFRKK